MKNYFLTILSILIFFTSAAQKLGENALFLIENSPKTYQEIRSFAEDKWNDDNGLIIHEINIQANSAMYFNKISKTVDGDIFYSAVKKWTENGLTNWTKVEFEYKKQLKKSFISGEAQSDDSNLYINANTQKKSHREEFGLIGNVKAIKETSYKVVEKFGEITKEKGRRDKYLNKDFYFDFNNKGYITREYKYESDGSLYSEYNYSYNSKGEITKCKGTARLMSFLVPTDYYYTFKYDSNGNIIQESLYQSSKKQLIYKNIYKYDINDNQIAINYYQSNGNLESKSIYKHDDKGNEIEGNHYTSDGKLASSTKYYYNDKSDLVEWRRFAPDGSLVNLGTFKYDFYGNIVERGDYSYTYEYDQKGNWILKKEFLNNVREHIIEREIEYF